MVRSLIRHWLVNYFTSIVSNRTGHYGRSLSLYHFRTRRLLWCHRMTGNGISSLPHISSIHFHITHVASTSVCLLFYVITPELTPFLYYQEINIKLNNILALYSDHMCHLLINKSIKCSSRRFICMHWTNSHHLLTAVRYSERD